MRPVLSANWIRLLGITTLFLLSYIVVVGVFGKVNISAWLPMRMAETIREAWPQMPFFSVQQQPSSDQGVTYYTVPTRQLSRPELVRMGVTNSVERPGPP